MNTGASHLRTGLRAAAALLLALMATACASTPGAWAPAAGEARTVLVGGDSLDAGTGERLGTVRMPEIEIASESADSPAQPERPRARLDVLESGDEPSESMERMTRLDDESRPWPAPEPNSHAPFEPRLRGLVGGLPEADTASPADSATRHEDEGVQRGFEAYLAYGGFGPTRPCIGVYWEGPDSIQRRDELLDGLGFSLGFVSRF